MPAMITGIGAAQMAAILRKLWKIVADGLAYSARTTALHEVMPWGDGPRPLWTKRGDRS